MYRHNNKKQNAIDESKMISQTHFLHNKTHCEHCLKGLLWQKYDTNKAFGRKKQGCLHENIVIM